MNYVTTPKPPRSSEQMLNQFGVFIRHTERRGTCTWSVHPLLVAPMLHISDSFIDYLPMATGRQSPYSEFDPRHAGATVPSWTCRSPPRGLSSSVGAAAPFDRNPAVKQIVSRGGRIGGKKTSWEGGGEQRRQRERESQSEMETMMERRKERGREGGRGGAGLCNISRMVVGTYQWAEPSITPSV